MLLACIYARSLSWERFEVKRQEFLALRCAARALADQLGEITEAQWTSRHATTALRRSILGDLNARPPYDGLVQSLATLKLQSDLYVSISSVLSRPCTQSN